MTTKTRREKYIFALLRLFEFFDGVSRYDLFILNPIKSLSTFIDDDLGYSFIW